MTELQSALLELAERGSAADPSGTTQRALGAAMARQTPLRRRWPAVLVSAAAAVALAVAASALYVRTKADDVDRVDLAGALAPSAAVAEPLNILVVGVDEPQDPQFTARADSIALVRVSKARGVIAVLSIPRDLYVDEVNDRINVAASDRPRLIGIVQRVTGLPVNHYAEIDGWGFRRMVDAFGGVTVFVPTPVRDRLAGLDLPAGCARLNGEQALAWERSRHVEVFEDGRWVVDPTGDLGRIQRQQQLAVLALRQLGATRDPRTLNRLLDIAADNVRVDADFPLARVRDWANATTGDGLTLLTLPTTPAQLPSGAAVLQLDESQLGGAVAAFDDAHSNHSVSTSPSSTAASTCAV